GLAELVVEAADAREARGERDARHGEIGLVDELPGEVEPAGAGDRARGGAELLREEAAEVALADTEPLGQRRRALLERALADQPDRAGHGGRGAERRRAAGRGLGAAAEAGAEAGLLGGRGAGEEAHVLAPGQRRGAAGAAVDARRGDAEHEAAFEAS